MKRAFLKDSIRKVLGTLNRFIAIAAITGLGVAFFAGIKATAPDMQNTAQSYYSELNFMDIRLLASAGFTNNDVAALNDVKGVLGVMPAFSADVLLKQDDYSLTVKLQSLDIGAKADSSSYINRPKIIEGRMPENENECLADSKLIKFYKFSLGDEVTFISGNQNKITNTLKNTTYKIVGVAENPLYISLDRGSATIGNGKMDCFFLIPSSSFAIPVYSEVYLTVNNPNGYGRFNDKYNDLIKLVTNLLNKLGTVRSDIRYEEIKSAAQVKTPVWYVLGHDTNAGFSSFKQDAERIAALGMVFPLIFFLVAALVSLTTMTRLVEDDRTYIGTMKALGYGRVAIASKYLIYAISASILGSILGLVAGFNVFPRVIFNAYGILYKLPPIKAQFNIYYAVLSSLAAVLCATLPAFVVCLQSLSVTPASLMRPKVPQAGKRIFLEYVRPLWKRMNFSQKVTARNLFRYKKRLLMTVVGVAGCTALIFTGFGLRDSISTIVGKQYEEIKTYDMQLDLKENASLGDVSSVKAMLGSVVTGNIQVRQQSVDILKGDTVKSAYLVVPQNTGDLTGYINLRERIGRKLLAPDDNSVVITEKLANILNLKNGDKLRLRNTDGVEKDATIGGICENYLFHYIYMSPSLYSKLYGEDVAANQLLCKLSDKSKSTEDSLSAKLMNQPGVSSVSFTTGLKDTFSKMIVALRYVVLVLIASAAALAFVVLFSLTSINIDERRRELATIKVLGFFNSELAAYTYRENILLTLFGTVFGLILGVVLERFVINTSEVEMVMFSRDLLWQSYVYSAGFTFIFAAIVNLIMLPHLKKIDMVSSLKSVE